MGLERQTEAKQQPSGAPAIQVTTHATLQHRVYGQIFLASPFSFFETTKHAARYIPPKRGKLVSAVTKEVAKYVVWPNMWSNLAVDIFVVM